MQAGGAAFEKAFTEFGDHIQAEGAYRVGVIAIALEFLAHPAWNVCAAGIREAGEFCKAGDGHDARHNRYFDTQRPGFIDEVKIGVGVVKVLRDG